MGRYEAGTPQCVRPFAFSVGTCGAVLISFVLSVYSVSACTCHFYAFRVLEPAACCDGMYTWARNRFDATPRVLHRRSVFIGMGHCHSTYR